MAGLPGLVPLAPLAPLKSLEPPAQAGAAHDAAAGAASPGGAHKAGNDFAQFLNAALQQVDGLQKEADAASLGLATGQIQDLHTVMIALEKASLSMALTVEVRNKVLDAYHEIMRMQI